MCALKHHFLVTELEDPCEFQEIEVGDLVIIDKEKSLSSDTFYGVVVKIKDNDAAILTESRWRFYKDRRDLQKLRINDYSTYLRDDLLVLALKTGSLLLNNSSI